MKPLISIIIPTYNRAYILENAIKSVLEQTYSAWELIIVDNGSTDNTPDCVNKFKDNRITTIKEANNLGPALARNKGLEVANGEWITYLDSDNEFLPNYLTSMVNNLLN
jgi:glycosyltransferase involved in cell wall biosynthesis